MKFIFILAFRIFLFGCQPSKKKEPLQTLQVATIKWDSIASRSYEEIKLGIEEKRKQFSLQYSSLSTLNKKENLEEITSYRVTTISKDLYSKAKTLHGILMEQLQNLNKEILPVAFL